MLQPKRTKFRKMMKGRNRGFATRGNKVSFGQFGLRTEDTGAITARQLEAARRALTRHIKRGGKVWIRIFPDKPITKKPLEVRQGKGKGPVEFWVALVQPVTRVQKFIHLFLILNKHTRRLDTVEGKTELIADG